MPSCLVKNLVYQSLLKLNLQTLRKTKSKYSFHFSFHSLKGSFFWDLSQDMSSSCFLPSVKCRPLIGWPSWSTNTYIYFWWDSLNSCPNSRSQKKLSLVNANIDHAVYLVLGGKIKKLKMRNKSHLLCGFSAKTLDSHLEITFLSSSFLLLPICCSFSFFKTVKYLPPQQSPSPAYV